MCDIGSVVDLLERKGWHLYETAQEDDPVKLLSKGRATRLAAGQPYYLVPATSTFLSAEEKLNELRRAAIDGKLPRFSDGLDDGVIKAFAFGDKKLSLVLHSHTVELDFESTDQVQRIIRDYVSNYYAVRFFASVAELEAFAAERKMTPQAKSPLTRQTRWTYVTESEDSSRIGMYPENPGHFLFRGQTQRFSPCWSTASRNIAAGFRKLHELSEKDQATVIDNMLRADWFIRNLRNTAPCQWLEDQGMHIDEYALAQHYGLPTGCIDLTQSLNVALCFACGNYDSVSSTWNPVSEGEGVIYVLDFRKLNDFSFVKAIGHQAFPRPSEQWGWTYEMTLGDDFDLLPMLSRWYFKHDLKESQRVVSRFSGAQTLFPDDPLAKLAAAVKRADVLPRNFAELVMDDLIDDPAGLPGCTIQQLSNLVEKHCKTRFADEAPIPDLENLRAEIEHRWDIKRESFFEDTGFTLVRSRPNEPLAVS